MYLKKLAEKYEQGKDLTIVVKVGSKQVTKEYMQGPWWVQNHARLGHMVKPTTHIDWVQALRLSRLLHSLCYRHDGNDACMSGLFVPRHKCIFVCSGAVALGRDYVDQFDESNLKHRSRAAAIGQPLLTYFLTRALTLRGFTRIEEVLVLPENVRDAHSWQCQTIKAVIDDYGIPIINEDDTQFPYLHAESYLSDNDKLVVEIAKAFPVDLVVFLTNQLGYIDTQGSIVEILTEESIAQAQYFCDDKCISNGGMSSKLTSVHELMQMGIPSFIASMTPETALGVHLANFFTPMGTLCVPNGYLDE